MNAITPAKLEPAPAIGIATPMTTPSSVHWRTLLPEVKKLDIADRITTPDGQMMRFRLRRSLSSDELRTVRTAEREYRAAIQGCGHRKAAEIVQIMRALYRNSFRWREMSNQELEAVAYTWVNDLAQYPADLIALAFEKWRSRRNSKGEPPGDVGQLMDPVFPILDERKADLEKIVSVITYQERAA